MTLELLQYDLCITDSTVNTWDSLPTNLKQLEPLNSFKKQVRTWKPERWQKRK